MNSAENSMTWCENIVDSSQITTIVSTSPIKAHPSTHFMDETIASIRHHLPDSPIIITADEVWSKLEHYRENYYEYLRRIENRYDSNVRIHKFATRTHQTEMTQYAIRTLFIQTYSGLTNMTYRFVLTAPSILTPWLTQLLRAQLTISI